MLAERIATIDEVLSPPGAASAASWLTPGERERLAELRNVARARQWLAGRRLVKELVLENLEKSNMRPADIHIESRDGKEQGSPPRVFLRGRLQPWRVSLSHSDQSVYAAIAFAGMSSVGVDIVLRRRLPDAFARWWLTPAERAWLGFAAPEFTCLLWSLKESWYKALGGNRPFIPRECDMTEAANLGLFSPAEVASQPRPCLRRDKHATIFCQWRPEEVATIVQINRLARAVAPFAARAA